MSRPDGTCDWQMYRALHTDMSLDEALDIDEIVDVARSWQCAVRKNLADQREQEGRERERRRRR